MIGAAQQAEVWNRFHQQIDSGTEGAAEDDDEKPIAFRAAAKEMNERRDLNEQAPRIEKMAETEHSYASVTKMFCLS